MRLPLVGAGAAIGQWRDERLAAFRNASAETVRKFITDLRQAERGGNLRPKYLRQAFDLQTIRLWLLDWEEELYAGASRAAFLAERDRVLHTHRCRYGSVETLESMLAQMVLPSGSGGVGIGAMQIDASQEPIFRVGDPPEEPVIPPPVTLYLPSFYGGLPVGYSPADILDLPFGEWPKSSRTDLPFTVVAGKLIFAYPEAYGPLSHIVDQNGYVVTGTFTATTANLTLAGTPTAYRIYENEFVTTQTNFKLSFYF